MFGEEKNSDFGAICTNGPVLVTGATGFVAGHLIQQLLMRGYKVRGTVRDLSKPEKFAYLSKLQNAAENLELVEANLRNDANHKSWEDAFDGVEYVMHVASPVGILFGDPLTEMIDPAVLGTRVILEHCQSSPLVKKLILTSCMCAITESFEYNRKYSEQDWNDTASPSKNIYSYSKTTAESEAVAAASLPTASFQLVSILPGTILGPHLGGHIAFSHRFLLNFIQEKRSRGVPNLSFALSDARDVARFHIAAMEQSSASGRYICANPPITLQKMLQIIHENFADMNVSTRPVPDALVKLSLRSLPVDSRETIINRLSKPPLFSRARSKQMNVPLRTPAETVVDTCRYSPVTGRLDAL